jgi:hypothetical protein
VAGVKFPFTIRSTGGLEYTTRYREILVNVPIDDAQFDKPAGH